MICIFTSKERPFCWGVNREKNTRNGFCAFLKTPSIIDRSVKQRPRLFFTCKLENERLFSSSGKVTCKYYTRGTKKAIPILVELRKKHRNSLRSKL